MAFWRSPAPARIPAGPQLPPLPLELGFSRPDEARTSCRYTRPGGGHHHGLCGASCIGDIDLAQRFISTLDELDFTVVGPAVSEIDRIASLCRSVDRDLLGLLQNW